MNKVSPIVLTPGEPAGIGPDLVVQLAQQDQPMDFVVIADPRVLTDRAEQLGLPLVVNPYDPNNLVNKTGQLTVLPVLTKEPVQTGILNPQNSAYVMATLQRAVSGCLQGEFSALVTGPVHKAIINQASIKFSGHTEFLANATSTDHTVMLLATKNIRVALVTTHCPLRAVSDTLTPELLTKTLLVLEKSLQQRFKIKKPRILVCGLNPHAGEGGYLGREEIEIIIPVLDKLKKSGMQLCGPFSADTAFIPQNLKQCDVVVCMYHDQGLPVIKALGFEEAVNITLGLPFLRTSVDHGTALELAGTGQANPASLIAALQMAEELNK